MNYGYAAAGRSSDLSEIHFGNGRERYQTQLYHHVATAVALRELDVLEVGSGRGGGSYYIHRYLKTRSMTGVDLAAAAVDFCNLTHQLDGLSFDRGSAESLPFDDHSFDAVVNIESSHCYSSMEQFLEQTRRVLRPGGHLLYADFRYLDQIDELRAQLESSGMEVVKEIDITAGVVRALDLDGERKAAAIAEHKLGPLIKYLREFAALPQTECYREFRDRDILYLHFVLRKPRSG